MIIDEPGYRPGPPKPRPTAPKPKPKPKPVYRPPARPASRPPGVAAPYRPKPKTTTPLRPANFSTITASARSRVSNTYAPGGPSLPLSYANPTPVATSSRQVYGPMPAGKMNDYEKALTILGSGFSAATTPANMALVAAVFDNMNQQPAAAVAAAKAKGGRSGGSGYYPRAYYGGGGSYGGGGGGGGGGSDFERYGMTKDWMEAYKTFWGHAMPSEYYGMFSPVQELFSRYQSRLPQLDDWQRIWQSAKDYMVGAGKDAKNMPKNLALYEPWIAGGVRPPLFTPPAISYAPTLSF